MGFNCLKATATSRKQFTFYHSVPRKSWYSLCRPRKDERLSQPWSHTVVLNTGPLDQEPAALTARPLLHCSVALSFIRTSNIWSSKDNFLYNISIILFTLLKNHINLGQVSPVKNVIFSSDFKHSYKNLKVLRFFLSIN